MCLRDYRTDARIASVADNASNILCYVAQLVMQSCCVTEDWFEMTEKSSQVIAAQPTDQLIQCPARADFDFLHPKKEIFRRLHL